MNVVTRRAIGPLTKKDDVPKERVLLVRNLKDQGTKAPTYRAELLHVLLLDFDLADRIAEFWGNPKTRTFAELLIDRDSARGRPVARLRP
jgi:hypothetical protein